MEYDEDEVWISETGWWYKLQNCFSY